MTKISLLAALPLFFFLAACTPSASVKIKKPEKFHYGETVGDRYTNPYFGLSVTAPTGWEQQTIDRENSDRPFLPDLFQVFEYPTDSGFIDNANLYVFAERKNHDPFMEDETDYLNDMKATLKTVGHTDDEMTAIETTILGAKPFRRMTVTTYDAENDLETRQEYFVRLIKDYWLVIIETTYYEEDKAIIDRVLKDLKVD